MRKSKTVKTINQLIEALIGLSVVILPFAYISNIIYPNYIAAILTEVTASIICLIVIYVVVVKQVEEWRGK